MSPLDKCPPPFQEISLTEFEMFPEVHKQLNSLWVVNVKFACKKTQGSLGGENKPARVVFSKFEHFVQTSDIYKLQEKIILQQL